MRNRSVATQSLRGRRRSSAPPSSSTRSSALQIYVFRGETFLGTELFDPTRPVSVGRHHDAQLKLGGETISRYHCRVSVEDDALFVEDLGSGNGTIVNHEPVTSRTRVDTGDQVHVGPYSMRLRLLRAPGPRPYDPTKSEDTTKINAILAAERADRSTDEVALESNPSLDDALYREALRRSSGGEVAKPLSAAPDEASMEEDSTQMAADALLPGSEASVPVVASFGSRPDVDQRLADLDRLIASLEAEERPDSMGPWKPEQTFPTVEHDDDGFAHSEPARPISTREFARDLASRLALDGAVVPANLAEPEADVIPLRRDTPLSAPLDDDEDDTEAELPREPAPPAAPVIQAPDGPLDPALLAAAEMDDTPETELLDGLPPQVEAALPHPRVLAQPPPAEARESASRRVAKPRPKGLSIPGGPRMPSWVVSRQAMPRPVPSAPMVPPEPGPSADRRPPPLPDAKRRKKAVEARLMTPTGLQVDVLPAPASAPAETDGDSGLSDVWSKSEAAVPEASILRRTFGSPRRTATEAKPKAAMDDYASALARLPDEPIPTHFDGVEVAARVNGQLVDISVLRHPKDEYILGHRTPQGAVAPAKAHVGLRLVRINPDRSVDLVFPKEVGGHLVRGHTTAAFQDLSEGRKYSCLRLDPRDVATVVLGASQDQMTYHVRFLRRPKSLFRSLRGLKKS